MEKEYVKYENYFLDRTKIEANARKFSFVWSKSTKRYSESLQKKIRGLLKDIKEVTDSENKEYGIKTHSYMIVKEMNIYVQMEKD